MRIVMICESFAPVNGIAEVVDNLAAEFTRFGHEVAIVFNPAPVSGGPRTPRVSVECAGIRIPRAKPISWRHPERLLVHAQATRLLQFLRQWRAELVNFQGGVWERFPAGLKACAAAGVHVVVTLHYPADDTVRAGRAALAMNSADALTFVSEATRRSFEPLAKRAAEAHVILNGVDCVEAGQATALKRDRPYIFCAARLNLQHKALDALVQAFRAIAHDYPEHDLLITGDGPDRLRLAEIIDSLGLGPRIQLLGVRPRSEMWSLYKGATLFALPSRKPEGLGLAFLEAMACGCPVIGTNSGGTPEIVRSGASGLLIEQNQPGEIASALRGLLANPELRQRLGSCGRQSATQSLGWPQAAQKYLAVYEQVLAGRR